MKAIRNAAALIAVLWFLCVNVLFFWLRFHHSHLISTLLGR